MGLPSPFKLANFGGETGDVQNAKGNPLYKRAIVSWSRASIWLPSEPAPTGLPEDEPGYLYALIKNHGRTKKKDNIEYIGMPNNLRRRFYDHPVAKELVNKRGATSLSIGTVDFGSYRTAITHTDKPLKSLNTSSYGRFHIRSGTRENNIRCRAWVRNLEERGT